MDLLLASGLHLRGELNARASLVARAVSLSMSTPVPLRTVTSTTGGEAQSLAASGPAAGPLAAGSAARC